MTATNTVSGSIGLWSRKVGGELVVLDFDSSPWSTVRARRRLPFEPLNAQRHHEELMAAFLVRTDIDEGTVRRDVDIFLSDLSGTGLLSTYQPFAGAPYPVGLASSPTN